MEYFKALPSCKEKILAWDKKDYHALAASMDLEEIRSMNRELYEEEPRLCLDNKSAETVLYNYINLLAYVAEMYDEDEAAALYEILFAI